MALWVKLFISPTFHHLFTNPQFFAGSNSETHRKVKYSKFPNMFPTVQTIFLFEAVVNSHGETTYSTIERFVRRAVFKKGQCDFYRSWFLSCKVHK